MTDALTEGWRTKSALVRTDCRIKLVTEAAVDLNLAVVVDPAHAKLNAALWLDNPVNDACFYQIRTLFHNRSQRFEHLADCLEKFRFTRVASANFSYTSARYAFLKFIEHPPFCADYFN